MAVRHSDGDDARRAPRYRIPIRSHWATLDHCHRPGGVQRRRAARVDRGQPLGHRVTAIVAYAAGVAITTAATSAYITDVTRRARYGAAHGVFGTIYDIGDALGPISAGLLVAMLGYAHMFQVMAAVAVTMAVAFVITTSRHSSRA